LRVRDPAYVERVERSLATQSGIEDRRSPMFTPFTLRGMSVVNRVVVSPMAQYSAADGMPDDWHLVHYGARATGGAGLVFTEMTCVAPEARITPGCTGLWDDAQRDAWQRIVDFVHRHSRAKICLQLGHAGRKGSTQVGWEQMDHPLGSGNWPLLAPSPIPYLKDLSATPRAMDRDDMLRVIAQFERSTALAAEAGFDMIEVHAAHGYLLASFISPLTNVRTDAYGGELAGRMRFPLEVIRAVRARWPSERPLSVRISATDWAEGGLSEEDLCVWVAALRDAGVDIIDVSTGQTVADQAPVYGRMWQTPFSDLVRAESGLPTIAVGNIYEADHVDTIIAAGRADLCAIARPHLADPSWTLRVAAEQGFAGQHWPAPYLSARSQLERNLQRSATAPGPV
jgi:anthraniloyl-CoA monooxygenase